MFANATLTQGEDGEAIVTFAGGGGTGGDEMFGGTSLMPRSVSTTQAGGGSPGGNAEMTLAQEGFTGADTQSDTSQSTWEA